MGKYLYLRSFAVFLVILVTGFIASAQEEPAAKKASLEFKIGYLNLVFSLGFHL